jgi:hypothetical protein
MKIISILYFNDFLKIFDFELACIAGMWRVMVCYKALVSKGSGKRPLGNKYD